MVLVNGNNYKTITTQLMDLIDLYYYNKKAVLVKERDGPQTRIIGKN